MKGSEVRPQVEPLTPTAQKVLDAAVLLLRETGQLSMRRLAQTAGVAGMTPYNLFGSKHGLLAALSQNELNAAMRRLDSTPHQDSLRRIFTTLDLGFDTFGKEPDYYKALYRAAYASNDPTMVEVFQAPRIAYWNSLLEACRKDGFLEKATRSDTLTQVLMYTYTGAVGRWIEHTISTRQLYAEINYTLMILLLSHVAPHARDAVQQRMRHWERFLHA